MARLKEEEQWKIMEDCDFAVDGLAFTVSVGTNDMPIVTVQDVRQGDNKAVLILPVAKDPFRVKVSTFSTRGKRRWQMLYTAEVNKKLILRLCKERAGK